MLKYEIVTLPAKKLVGLKTRTGHNDPEVMSKIGSLWREFMEGGMFEKLQKTPDAYSYGVYTNYGWDDGTYDTIVACEGEDYPEGLVTVEIPAGKYAKFSFHGDVREATSNMWGEIWSMQLPRAFTVDFEEYTSYGEDGQGDINIYIALADICQSCGMPMTAASDYGTEADGKKSRTYCCYCYQDGKFTGDYTMDEIIEFNLNCEAGQKLYKDKDAARKQMQEYFPTLERWKNN